LLVRAGAADGTGASLGPWIRLLGHRGGSSLPFLHDREALGLEDDRLDIAHDMVIHHGEAPRVAADLLVLTNGDGDQAAALRLAALTHHAHVPVGGRGVSILDSLVDLPGDRFVALDASLPVGH